MSPHRNQHLYHAGDLGVLTSSEHTQLLDSYLSGYLAGPVGTHAFPPYQLTLHTGHAEVARAAAEFTQEPTARIEPIPGVVLTARQTSAGLRCFTIDEDRLENAPGAWAASIRGTKIDLYVTDPPRSPRYVLRIIREVMIRSYENAGGILFHAAGLDIGGKAVMLCGSRGTGKTTTLAALLDFLGDRAALLSNDRLLALDDRQIIAVPLPVPVASGTIEAFPQLRAATSIALRARPGEVPLGDLPREFGTASKLAFPARVFAAAFHAGLIPGSRLATVIIPVLTDTSDPAAIRRLSPAAAARAIAACCFTPHDEFWRPWLVSRTRTDHDLTDAAQLRCRQIADAVPSFTVSCGIRAPLAGLQQALTQGIGAHS